MTKFYFAFIILFNFSSFAQETDSALTLDKKDTKPMEKAKEGWTPSLNLGAQVSFGSSSNVIGQPDGDSKTFGANLDGAYNYKHNKDEWQNSLKIKGASTTTPALPRYVKSSDELNFVSLYLHSLEAYPWMGPYVRVQAKTSLFKGEDVQAADKTYIKRTRAGATQETQTTSTLRLTDGFKPLSVKESVGVFFKLLEKPKAQLTARLGYGAIQVDASGQYAINDDDTTPQVEVEELASYSQNGVEGGFVYKGKIDDKTSYSLIGEFLTPINPDLEAGDERDDLEMTNRELTFKLTSKVYEWMSFNYEYSVKKEPQLLPRAQQQHLMSLSFAYSLL